MSKLIASILFLIGSLCAVAQEKTLDLFINAGITQSPLLKDLKNQKRGNAIDSLRIDASYKPQITASSTNSYAPTYK